MNKQYRKNNRNKINKHLLNKYHTNIHYKLSCILRKRVIKSLKGYSKSKKTMELLGCTIDKLWKHLKNKFQPGMTKENHGQWHLDHVRPCASFDLTDPKQQAMCFHYTNLQPLWAVDNLKKGAKHETTNA
jgi:cAMP phosphodiesterase